MKRNRKVVFIALAVLLVGIQIIPVDRVNPPADPAQDYINIAKPPTAVATILKEACYDCHSHSTTYPWYAYIAPVSFWIKGHINDGRRHLNFATWGTYEGGRKARKLGECADEVESKGMPENFYTWMHASARLTDAQREELTTWFKSEEEKTMAQLTPEELKKMKEHGREHH